MMIFYMDFFFIDTPQKIQQNSIRFYFASCLYLTLIAPKKKGIKTKKMKEKVLIYDGD